MTRKQFLTLFLLAVYLFLFLPLNITLYILLTAVIFKLIARTVKFLLKKPGVSRKLYRLKIKAQTDFQNPPEAYSGKWLPNEWYKFLTENVYTNQASFSKYDLGLLILIVVSALNAFTGRGEISEWIEKFVTIVFITDMVIRGILYRKNYLSFKKIAFWIDIVSVSPYFLEKLFAAQHLSFMVFIRALRLLRLLKLVRFTSKFSDVASNVFIRNIIAFFRHNFLEVIYIFSFFLIPAFFNIIILLIMKAGSSPSDNEHYLWQFYRLMVQPSFTLEGFERISKPWVQNLVVSLHGIALMLTIGCVAIVVGFLTNVILEHFRRKKEGLVNIHYKDFLLIVGYSPMTKVIADRLEEQFPYAVVIDKFIDGIPDQEKGLTYFKGSVTRKTDIERLNFWEAKAIIFVEDILTGDSKRKNDFSIGYAGVAHRIRQHYKDSENLSKMWIEKPIVVYHSLSRGSHNTISAIFENRKLHLSSLSINREILISLLLLKFLKGEDNYLSLLNIITTPMDEIKNNAALSVSDFRENDSYLPIKINQYDELYLKTGIDMSRSDKYHLILVGHRETAYRIETKLNEFSLKYSMNKKAIYVKLNMTPVEYENKKNHELNIEILKKVKEILEDNQTPKVIFLPEQYDSSEESDIKTAGYFETFRSYCDERKKSNNLIDGEKKWLQKFDCNCGHVDLFYEESNKKKSVSNRRWQNETGEKGNEFIDVGLVSGEIISKMTLSPSLYFLWYCAIENPLESMSMNTMNVPREWVGLNDDKFLTEQALEKLYIKSGSKFVPIGIISEYEKELHLFGLGNEVKELKPSDLLLYADLAVLTS
jgi:hypothetical protein